MPLAKILEAGTIRSRLFGALVLLAALPVLVLVLSLFLLGRMSGDARRIELAASLRMGGFVIAAQLYGHVSQPSASRVQILRDEMQRMGGVLEALARGSSVLEIAAVDDPHGRQCVADTRRVLTEYGGLVERVLQETRDQPLDPARRNQVSSEALHMAYTLVAVTQRLVHHLEGGSNRALRQLWLLQATAVLVAVGVLGLTLWAVNRYVLQPVPPLLAALGDVRAGRYDTRVEVRGENELSQVARGFNAMSSELERTQHALVMQQAEILEKNAELERASLLKSQFVANMSHELRTPLNAIIGYTKLLRSGIYGELPPAMQEPLQGVDETSAALLRLINDILDVAKIEAGRMDLHTERFHAEDVVRQVGEMMQPLAIGKGLELQILLPESMPPVITDRDKLRRILLNLAGNAVKFTRRGRVTLELVPPAADGPVDVARFAVVVRDTGLGIAAEHQEFIFEDFRQVDGSTAREHGGTGLGLGISRRLARHLGGDIHVQSQVGQGSTFTLQLPVVVRIDATDRSAHRLGHA